MATVDDVITLGGQNFPVRGVIKSNALAEFEQGLKIGKATYDQREHAFFLVLDDFSAGMGHRRLDIREELGNFWDVASTNMPDLRRSGHMTLPPPIASTSPTAAAAHGLSATPRFPSYPWLRLDDNTYIFGFGSSIYRTTDSGATWDRVHAGGADVEECTALVRFVGRDASLRYFAAFSSVTNAGTGTARYQKSTDGITWSNGAVDRVIHDMFVWDNKLIGGYLGTMIFAVLVAGVESWNLDDVNDAEFIMTGAIGGAQYIGVAQAPWGEPALYFFDVHSLWVLDFFARKGYPIDIGMGKYILDGCMFNGDIALTDGWNTFLYSPGGNTVRNIGLPRKEGVTPSLQGASSNFQFRKLIASDQYLYASMSSQPDNATWLYVYNGIGWQPLGAKMTSFYCYQGFQANYVDNTFATVRKIHLVGFSTGARTAPIVKSITLPNANHIPTVGRDSFGSSGAAWLTGWIDGGFAELDGALFRLHCDGWNFSSTETVKVEYQLDNAESGSWTQMVDSLNVADVFDNATRVLYFSAATPGKGIQFRTVRFRITLNRGGTGTSSPEVKAFTLVYLKKPEFRSSWSFRIDVNRMIERSTTTADQTFYVDGTPATTSNVWAKLQTLWGTKTLITLIVPNIEPSPGINVMVADMPMTIDDFRDAIKGKGYIDVQVLEPVEEPA